VWPGGPVRQPYSYLVPRPHILFKNSSTVFLTLCPDLVRLAGGGLDVVELPVRDVGLPEDEGQVEQQADQARGRTHPPDTDQI
jgi:hypothetical protein